MVDKVHFLSSPTINDHLYSEQYCATSCLVLFTSLITGGAGGTVPSLAGVGQCLSLAILQLCPHGHDVQEAAGARSEDVCTLAACTF